MNDCVERKVYWISTFGKKFEDSLVKLVNQYKGSTDSLDAIENIDYALGKSIHAREAITSCPEFVLITMSFGMENENVIYGPDFDVYEVGDKTFLERTEHTFVGYSEHTDRERYEIFQTATKFNL